RGPVDHEGPAREKCLTEHLYEAIGKHHVADGFLHLLEWRPLEALHLVADDLVVDIHRRRCYANVAATAKRLMRGDFPPIGQTVPKMDRPTSCAGIDLTQAFP